MTEEMNEVIKELRKIDKNNKKNLEIIDKWQSIVPGIDTPHKMHNYILKLEAEKKKKEEKLVQWQTILPNINNPANMQRHIQKLHKQLDINDTEENESFQASSTDMEDMTLYNEVFLMEVGNEYVLPPFESVYNFVFEKEKAIKVIMDEDRDPLSKLINDPHGFIKFFEMKKRDNIADKDFDVTKIKEYTKW